MRQLRHWVLVLFVVVAFGCNSGFTPDGPTAPQGIGSLAAGSIGVVASATGSGHFEVNGELRKFSFSANRLADGQVSGQFELVGGNADLVAHGHVTCLTVIGNEAWVGGVLDRNSVGAPFDSGRFRVADNGEGSEGPADAITLLFVAVNPGGDLAQEFCAETPALGVLNPIQAGNIQVH